MAETVPSTIALWKPFTGKGTTILQRDIVCLHTMVGTLAGSWNYANTPGNSYWHFGTSGTGECWQCQNLLYRSAANLYGNPYVIPIENADMGPGFGAWNSQCGNVPAFTDAQVNKLVQLLVYLCIRYSIPPVLISDTQIGRRGIAYHRQGIDPWRTSGLLWSSSSGKCCPDWRRIDQTVNIIIPRVREQVLGGTPPITPQEMFEMPYPVVRCNPTDPQYADRKKWMALSQGSADHVPDMEFYNAGVWSGVLAPAKIGNARQYDVACAMARLLGQEYTLAQRKIVMDKLNEMNLRLTAIQAQTDADPNT